MSDIKALQLESRFSMPPNSLGYCGQGTAAQKFQQCIIDGDCTGIEEEVSKFIVLYPYLRTIAKITNLPIFSYKVIEAYWIGNEQLKKAKPVHYKDVLNNFAQQGVPDWLIDELREKTPRKFIPSHLFQVLHVGVGRASGAVPFNLESINNCMIRWGQVEDISNDQGVVVLNSLERQNTSYSLTKITQTVPFKKELLPGLKKGDEVAVHWNMIVKILSQKEITDLKFWTNEVINSQ